MSLSRTFLGAQKELGSLLGKDGMQWGGGNLLKSSRETLGMCKFIVEWKNSFYRISFAHSCLGVLQSTVFISDCLNIGIVKAGTLHFATLIPNIIACYMYVIWNRLNLALCSSFKSKSPGNIMYIWIVVKLLHNNLCLQLWRYLFFSSEMIRFSDLLPVLTFIWMANYFLIMN